MCISELLRALCARKIHNNYDDMNYSKLIAAIDDRIRANGRREITGQTLHDVLEAMVRSLGAGYQVAGVLGPDDDPGEPDQRFAWLASEAGVYRHCGGVSVTELSWLIWGGGQWLVRAVDVPFGASVREWIADAVAEERSRALIAEALLQEGLDKEVADRTEAVAAEARKRAAADAEEKAAREKAVADEQARAESAERANAAAIAKEASDRAEAVKAEADARTAADTALDRRVTAVEGKIPAQASAENQLADKAFVNSSISTATATFRGTFESLEALKAVEADKNDYAFWVHKDEDGNTCYDKYTYDGAEWKFEYRLNNSSFTAAQWAAINSGVTADVIKALQDADKAHAKAIADEKTERIAAVQTEQTAREQADTANANAIATEVTERKAADATLQDNIDKKQDIIGDLATIRTQAEHGQTAFGWGDHSKAGYVKPFLITLTGDGSTENPYAIDKTFDEIAAAYQAKSLILLDDGGYLYAAGPISVEAENMYLTFAVTWADDNALWAYYIQGDAQKIIINRFNFSYVLSGNLATINGKNLENGGKDINVGVSTIQAGTGSKSEVFNGLSPSQASGFGSHAEGNGHASGNFSHAEGGDTIATRQNSHAEGAYNVSDGAAIHSVGIGESDTARKDAHRITYDGKHYILGIGGFDGTKATEDLTNEKDLATVISELESASGPFALAFTLGTGDKWSMDCTFEELAAAVDAKRGVIFTVNNGSYDGNLFTATLQQHSSVENVVVLQGYVNKAYLYVVVTNGSTGLTVEVSEVNLVNIDRQVVPSNENVPGTKAVKDYVDGKCEPCILQIYNSPEAGVEIGYNIESGELSPDSVIVIDVADSSDRRQLNVFGFRKISGSEIGYGYVLSRTGTMVKVTFALDAVTVTFDGDDI